jgi:hypothetical protein
MAKTSKIVNLAQLDTELGGHGLIADFNDESQKVISVADNSPVTEAELVAAIESHTAVFTEPTIAEKLASVGLSVNELKAALGL